MENASRQNLLKRLARHDRINRENSRKTKFFGLLCPNVTVLISHKSSTYYTLLYLRQPRKQDINVISGIMFVIFATNIAKVIPNIILKAVFLTEFIGSMT